jgi:hypothetical protein
MTDWPWRVQLNGLSEGALEFFKQCLERHTERLRPRENYIIKARPGWKRVYVPQGFLKAAADPVALNGTAQLPRHGKAKPRPAQGLRRSLHCGRGLSRSGRRNLCLGRHHQMRRHLQGESAGIKALSFGHPQEIRPSPETFWSRHSQPLGSSRRLFLGRG